MSNSSKKGALARQTELGRIWGGGGAPHTCEKTQTGFVFFLFPNEAFVCKKAREMKS
jgi:hypothetical protein